ncbi:MAG TPA: hypothetical protein VFT68_10980 [Lapillicoccus sp.]|nr:hypothetical protein [Lapillicoccus sp.]
MLAMITVFKLVARSFGYVGGLYGGPTIVPLPVPPYLPKPPEARMPAPTEPSGSARVA